MKKISLTLLAAILVIATTFTASAQTEQTRQVSGFTNLSASASFNVHVKIDGTESLKISADKDIINDIETVVKDGWLKIGFKSSIKTWNRNTGKVDVYVTAKSLQSLSNSGSGSIKVDGGELQGDVDVHVSGSGNITTAVKAEKFHAHISGSGSVNVNGTANDAELELSGSGQINGRMLKAENVKVHISGSGNADVDANKTISAHISGSGGLTYRGNATLTDAHTSGSGRVRKRDND